MLGRPLSSTYYVRFFYTFYAWCFGVAFGVAFIDKSALAVAAFGALSAICWVLYYFAYKSHLWQQFYEPPPDDIADGGR